MSFILDALRKSEHERQRSTVPGLAQIPLATPKAELPRWTVVVIGVLAAAVLALGGAWWQSTRERVELAAATPASTPVVERPVALPPPPQTSAPPTTTAPPADRVGMPPPRTASEPSALATAAAPSASEPSASRPLPPPVADEPALPSAAALAAEGIAVPSMRIELHRFREQASERFVFINGRKYVEGDRLSEGPQLVSIVPAGAVLVHAGRRFLLVPE